MSLDDKIGTWFDNHFNIIMAVSYIAIFVLLIAFLCDC